MLDATNAPKISLRFLTLRFKINAVIIKSSKSKQKFNSHIASK